MTDKLPTFAYVVTPTGPIAIVKRGELGFWPAPGMTVEAADKKNFVMGVSHAEREAMLAGSMFGWDCPGAMAINCTWAKALVEQG